MKDTFNSISSYGRTLLEQPQEQENARRDPRSISDFGGTLLESGSKSVAGSHMTASDIARSFSFLNECEIFGHASGGMGTVCFIRSPRFGLDLAIKQVDTSHHGRSLDLDVFTREAENWIDLGYHPNIATAYSVTRIGNVPSLMVEFVHGTTLFEFLQKERLPMNTALSLGLHIARAMEHAHDRGIVHRDLKPQNIMLTPELVPKIVDFGLSFFRRFTIDDSKDHPQKAQCENGNKNRYFISGTPTHMAPELWLGMVEASPKSDIYAFGVVLFQMLYGVLPFPIEGDSLKEVVKQQRKRHLYDTIPNLSLLSPLVPDTLKNLIHACLDKQEENRPSNFCEITSILSELDQNLSSSTPKQSAIEVSRHMFKARFIRMASTMDKYLIAKVPNYFSWLNRLLKAIEKLEAKGQPSAMQLAQQFVSTWDGVDGERSSQIEKCGAQQMTNLLTGLLFKLPTYEGYQHTAIHFNPILLPSTIRVQTTIALRNSNGTVEMLLDGKRDHDIYIILVDNNEYIVVSDLEIRSPGENIGELMRNLQDDEYVKLDDSDKYLLAAIFLSMLRCRFGYDARFGYNDLDFLGYHKWVVGGILNRLKELGHIQNVAFETFQLIEMD